MRKHSARKWLHFILDLLPVIILPVFAIYEINHDHNTPIEVEADVNDVIDFNQIVKNGSFESTSSWEANSYDTFTIQNGALTVVHDYPSGRVFQNNFITQNQCYYIVKGSCSTLDVDGAITFEFSRGWSNTNVRTTANEVIDFTQLVYLNNTQTNGNRFQIYAQSDLTYTIYDLNVFNITQMFGAGNEPTVEEFDSYFSDNYYEYTSSHKQLLNVGTETLSNTDIGSQLMYALYKPVKDYFNFNNVFNFGDIYHWFELNMFGGNAPMPIFIVWNIIVYQFLMDLMFLVYSIFMFIIDFTSECLERCFSFSRHGGSR